MKTSNPIFRDSLLNNNQYVLTDRPMTVAGTMNKLFVLSLVMLVGAAAVFYQFSIHHYDYVSMIMWIGIAVGLVCAIIIYFKHHLIPYLAPIYAFSQGAVLSGLSCFFEKSYPGIVTQAVSITFCTVLVMGVLYRFGLIKATKQFVSIILIATSAIGLFYFISIIMAFFGHTPSYFTVNTPVTITINAVIAFIAALNLIIDFDFIEKGTQAMLPSLYEWYGAYGLLVTILWIYIEVLRLLSRLRSR